jgi:hypothetical protein
MRRNGRSIFWVLVLQLAVSTELGAAVVLLAGMLYVALEKSTHARSP